MKIFYTLTKAVNTVPDTRLLRAYKIRNNDLVCVLDEYLTKGIEVEDFTSGSIHTFIADNTENRTDNLIFKIL